MDPRFSRAYGALAGLALGDALGMPTQAMSPQQIQMVYGQVTGLVDGDKSQPYAPGMAAGSVTDDTEQALLIASLLLKGHGSGLNLDAGEFSHALLAWEDSMIERGSLDLLGPSTKAALERVRAGENPLRVGGEGTTNGAAMRVTPIGIAASTSDRQLFADAVWSSCQVTHATRQGFQSAALVAAAVSLGIDAGAADVTDLLWKAVAFVRSLPERGAWSPEPDVVAATHRALKLAAQPSSSLEWLAGQIGTAVASAQAIPMAFALLARDPSPRALLQAANLGGDTDTIGAIAGAILGASLGVEVFDDYGLAQVEQVSQLDLPSVATDLLALRDREGGGAAPAAATTSPNPEKPALTKTPAASPQKGAPAGRVVLMGQILVDLAVRGEALPAPGGDVWASVKECMWVGALTRWWPRGVWEPRPSRSARLATVPTLYSSSRPCSARKLRMPGPTLTVSITVFVLRSLTNPGSVPLSPRGALRRGRQQTLGRISPQRCARGMCFTLTATSWTTRLTVRRRRGRWRLYLRACRSFWMSRLLLASRRAYLRAT